MDVYGKELLLALEEEEVLLSEQIDNAIKEKDFLAASYLQDALYLLQADMIKINRIYDAHYDEKEHLTHRRNFFLSDNYQLDPHLRRYSDTQLHEIDEKLKSFASNKSSGVCDTQIIDNALYDVIENRLSNFTLVLNAERNFFVHVTSENDQLIIGLTPLNAVAESQYSEDIFAQQNINRLIGLGFLFDESQNVFSYYYSKSRFKNALELKTLFARIIYDVFMNNVDNPISLRLGKNLDQNSF